MQNDITIVCNICDHKSDYREFVWITDTKTACQNLHACTRRQKRNQIIEDMTNKTTIHPVDRFSRSTVATCALFFVTIIAVGFAYLIFGL